MVEKLTAEQLNCSCTPEKFDFTTTAEIDHLTEELIGQDRAVEAMKLGLRVEQEGYNIFMSGLTGTGRRTYAQALAEEKSQSAEVPPDLCYVYNFSNPEKPQALKLPSGMGNYLQEDMENLIAELKEEIPEAFTGEEYEQKKNEIREKYQEKSNQLMEKFSQEAREQGFVLDNTAHGSVPIPLNGDGEPIRQDEFQTLEESKKQEIREESQKIQNDLEQIQRKIRRLKVEAQDELKELEKKIAGSVIQPIIANLEEKYEDCPPIIDYLEEVQQDIVENLDKFKNGDQNNSSQQKLALAYMQRGNKEDFFNRYQVNLLVDHQSTDGAPVVYESNPSYYNLFGKIEGKSEWGTIKTDFTMIKQGAIHEANGGYLILKAEDVLTKLRSWETLKRVLINQEIVVENIGEEYQTMPIATLKPEGIELDLKVIMFGSPVIYQLLYNYDEEFKKLFKIKADFDVEMERNKENMKKFASFVSAISDREEIKHFTDEAVGKIIEYSSRLAGDRSKMSTEFNKIIELLFEADAWAGTNGNDNYIDKEDVVKAIRKKEYRSNLVEEKIQALIEKGHILVDLEGETVGQINGLAVYQTGQYSFGRPSRITARTYLGQRGIVNIEREVELSGKVHDKGIMILSGFLGGKYAQEQPLSLSASLTFEQNYGGVDGDSASCAELIALLSAIAELSVKQNIAITGSLNQRGEIQPIGGVNEKVEGFYKTCQLAGLTGEQGVIIPHQNKDNLMLNQEVIEAVKAGEFNIYAVENVEEAIAIMMDREAEEVHAQVKEKLGELAEKAAEFKAQAGEDGQNT